MTLPPRVARSVLLGAIGTMSIFLVLVVLRQEDTAASDLERLEGYWSVETEYSVEGGVKQIIASEEKMAVGKEALIEVKDRQVFYCYPNRSRYRLGLLIANTKTNPRVLQIAEGPTDSNNKDSSFPYDLSGDGNQLTVRMAKDGNALSFDRAGRLVVLRKNSPGEAENWFTKVKEIEAEAKCRHKIGADALAYVQEGGQGIAFLAYPFAIGGVTYNNDARLENIAKKSDGYQATVKITYTNIERNTYFLEVLVSYDALDGFRNWTIGKYNDSFPPHIQYKLFDAWLKPVPELGPPAREINRESSVQ